ncbi:hypothetical protein, partial [Leptospira idonii]|uniref:hypothetical protein n=1 Tax=Leptospira idonii TaxID=1193500 RepID=UPI001AEFCC8A
IIFPIRRGLTTASLRNCQVNTILAQVIEFLKKNGIDYWSTPIPLGAKNRAKQRFPNDWEDYLKKY